MQHAPHAEKLGFQSRRVLIGWYNLIRLHADARARDRPAVVRSLLTYHKDVNSRYTCKFAVVTTWNESSFS